MTITPFELYMILKLDAIQGILITLGIVSAIIFTAFTISAFAADDAPIIAKIVLPILTLFFAAVCIVGVMTPSTKQAAMIYVAPRIINSDLIQQDIPKETAEIYGLAKQWLREQIPADKKG